MPAANASFDFSSHTRLIFGAGTIDTLGQRVRECAGARVLLVTDKGIVAAGHAERARKSLEKEKLAVTVFDDVQENPSTRHVAACIEKAKAGDIDIIVGLGGGSSMDTAKGANFILTNGGVMADYWGINKARKPMLPFIAIPTTAGTGSECQSFALIADETTHQKMACGDDKAYARIAILDPALTTSQPQRVTANTGIDAITHAIESHVTTVRSQMSQIFSREAWKLADTSFETVLSESENLEARGQMLLAAACAGTAIAQSMLGAAHSAANPLTAHFNVVHGQAVGVMLPHVMEFNSDDAETLRGYAELAANSGQARRRDDPHEAFASLLVRLDALLNAAQIPDNLEVLGIAKKDVRKLAEEAATQWTARFNPRPIAAGDFAKLFESALRPRHELLNRVARNVTARRPSGFHERARGQG